MPHPVRRRRVGRPRGRAPVNRRAPMRRRGQRGGQAAILGLLAPSIIREVSKLAASGIKGLFKKKRRRRGKRGGGLRLAGVRGRR